MSTIFSDFDALASAVDKYAETRPAYVKMADVDPDLQGHMRRLLSNKMPRDDFESVFLFLATCATWWPMLVKDKDSFDAERFRLHRIVSDSQDKRGDDTQKQIIWALYSQVYDQYYEDFGHFATAHRRGATAHPPDAKKQKLLRPGAMVLRLP